MAFRYSSAVRCLLVLAALVPLAHGASALAEPTLSPASSDEVLVYEWRLEGFKGLLLRLVAPGRGEGTLTTVLNDRLHLETELHISAERQRKGEYWLYGSEIDPRARRSLRAWSSQRVGDKSKERQADLEDENVIDVASGILLVRRDPPVEPRRMRIWSNGRLYPVLIEPHGEERRRFRGREAEVREFRIRGYRVPGEREWKGGIDLYLADDDSATPVEILVANKGVRVRMLLDEEASQLGLPNPSRATAGS